MDISIFGYKLNLEILILIGVVYLILVGHTFCGCCHFGAMEGLENMDNADKLFKTQVGTGIAAPAGQIVAGKTKEGSASKAVKEGFVGANTNYGESSAYEIGAPQMVDTSSWSKPDLTVVPGKPVSKAVQEIVDRPNGPIPLPEGEMFLFANTQFKPECCPNTYSTGDGCACMNTKTYNYLIGRGGNNVPYSEY